MDEETFERKVEKIEEFNFDRLVQYLQFKSKFMPPADNPRQALSQARNTRSKNLNMEHSLGNA